MQTEPQTKTCQNCKADFTIEPEDFEFYEKMKVPPPTWCPQCRMVRRMVWRNERALYSRKDARGVSVISPFAEDGPIVVYERDYWWSDDVDTKDFAINLDLSKNFFSQFGELLHKAPSPSLFNAQCINSNYCNHVTELKDCYLTFASYGSEKIYYSHKSGFCRDSLDLSVSDKCERCYEDSDCDNSYQLVFSQNSSNCTNSAFLLDCRDCHDCFGSVGLRNKQYHIFNKPYTKEEYEKKIKEFDLGSYETIKKVRKQFDTLKLVYPRRFARLINTINSTGDNLQNTKNCHFCFDKRGGVEDTKYAVHAGFGMKDSYDTYGVGICNLFYEAIDAGIGAANNKFVLLCLACRDISYSYNCHNSSNLFGCIGLRNKEYCILNKQYSKEEYEHLVPQIITAMKENPYTDAHGRIYGFGEFFPPELSPFAYNETIAHEYFPLTSDGAVSKGYRWRDSVTKGNTPTLFSTDIPDAISAVTDDILKQAIECEHAKTCQHLCAGAFRVTTFELEFLREMGIALPQLCPNCRHGERFSARNPVRLWQRSCMCRGKTSGAYTNTAEHFHGPDLCPNTFQTAYAPDRPEIVYCEECYRAEVI